MVVPLTFTPPHLIVSNFSNPLSISTYLIWMNNPLLESYVVVFNSYAFGDFSYDFLLMSAVFHAYQEKYVMLHHSAPWSPI